MKSIFWKFTLCAAITCTTSLLSNAAPLQRADVVADPAWLLHLDADALRPTTIGQFILSEMDKPEAKDKLAALQAISSIDLRTQLHGITLYGITPNQEDGVLIAYADFDAERLTILAKAANDYKSSKHNQHVIHSWVDEKKKSTPDHVPRIYASIAGNRVIFGQRESGVARVLDVIDGKTPNLTSGVAFPELGAADNGHFIEAAASKINLPASNPSAAILKLSKSVQLTLSEKQGQFKGSLTLVADTEDVAEHVLSIAQGLVALLKFQTDKPDAVAIASALVVKQDGVRVLGSISLPASKVVEMIKADAARKEAAHEEKQSKE